MPDEVTQAINSEGGLGQILSQGRAQAIVREANVTVVMNVETVKSTISSLSRLVEEIESRIKEATDKVADNATPEA